jgi:hypothetical protein
MLRIEYPERELTENMYSCKKGIFSYKPAMLCHTIRKITKEAFDECIKYEGSHFYLFN